MGLKAHVEQSDEIGYFRIYVTPPGGRRREITFFRGIPTEVTEIMTSDPFTDMSCGLKFPQVTVFDTLGVGDLDWMVAYADVDIVWENTGDTDYDWIFEGYLVAPTYNSDDSDNSVSWEVKGALLLGDNYLAAPSFPPQPIPYEILMAQAFDQSKRPSHLAPFQIEWPGHVNGTYDQEYYSPESAPVRRSSSSTTTQTTKTTVVPIRVATYNVLGNSDSFASRLPGIAKAIVATGATVVGCQEVSPFRNVKMGGKTKDQVTALLDELNKQKPFKVAKTTAATPVFYRSDRVAVAEHKNVTLRKGKAANMVKFAVIGQPGHFRYINIHPTHDSKADRKDEMKILVKAIAGMERTLIGGDLNDPGDNGDVRDILKDEGYLGLRTRNANIENASTESYKGLNGNPDKNSRWLDDILSKQHELTVDSGRLVVQSGLSDHHMIVANVSYKVTSTGSVTVTTVDETSGKLGEAKVVIPATKTEAWDRRVPTAGDAYNAAYRYAYLRPWGVVPGQLWTGFTTRSTGGWENMVTGYVQGLLSVMFEEAGAQWSIRKDRGRKPVLYLREVPPSNSPDILEVEVGAPGVKVNGTRDFSQSADTIYGEGQDDAGTTFSNAQVSVTADGPFTSYEPFSYNPATWPVEKLDVNGKGNPARNTHLMPKEAHIKFPQGMDANDARGLARGQRSRFADPGFTGTVTLTTDPKYPDGEPFPRLLVKAGRTIRLKGMFGLEQGITVHIVQASMNVKEMTLTLTVDSKYRDALTVSEVRARTRDALTPLRSLQVGKYSNTVQDLLFPWSYELGSGIIPSGGDADATPFFRNVSASDRFPYENLTRQFPPKTHGSYYIRVPKNPSRQDSTGSWTRVGVPVRMSAQGAIRLSQIAAYDSEGNVVPVKFHFSLYSTNGVSANDMPILIGAGERGFDYRYLKPPGNPPENYKVGQKYPFYETAWETVNENGEQFADGELNRYPANAGIVVGWGTYYEPAGFSPGRFSRGAPATGQLIDETQWTWDVSSLLNQQKASDNANNPDLGRLWAMVYCDDLPDQDVFFMGRLFRVEPGGS